MFLGLSRLDQPFGGKFKKQRAILRNFFKFFFQIFRLTFGREKIGRFDPPKVDESAQVVITGVGSAEFVRMQDQQAHKVELDGGHVELIDVTDGTHIFIRTAAEVPTVEPAGCEGTVADLPRVVSNVRQKRSVAAEESGAAVCDVHLVDLGLILFTVAGAGHVRMHVPHQLDALPGRIALLPDVAQIPALPKSREIGQLHGA